MIRTKGEGGEKEREATEEDGEGGKEAGDGDKSDGSMGGKREARMEHLEDEMGSLDGQRRRGAVQGDSRFVWGPIGDVSQNGGRRGEENDEGKRGVKKGK